MTQEEKQLLLRDLCARLPYHTKCYNISTEEDFELSDVTDMDTEYPSFDYGHAKIEDIKPYLRPMSSMTKEEKEDYFNICNEDFETLDKAEDAPYIIISDKGRTQGYIAHKELEWLYEHHFDFIRKVGDEYKTLTDLGLAIEAPEGMYNVKK